MDVRPVRLRDLEERDHPEVLALNEAHVELLSPLDEQRLRALVGWADRACVVELDDAVVGFVLTFASGSAYDGDNFGWFSEQLADVVGGIAYLDRIVLAEQTRRRGVATAVYDELERTCGRAVMCLEVNSEPPNEPSLAFHAARGYRPIAHRGEPGHEVAMMVKRLGDSPLPD